MHISGVTPQLRTTDLAGSIAFYTSKLGMTLAFQYQDFYAGIRAGEHYIHLKRVDTPDPSIAFAQMGGHLHLYLDTPDIEAAAEAVQRAGIAFLHEPHDTSWGTREFAIQDDQGHILYFSQAVGGT